MKTLATDENKNYVVYGYLREEDDKVGKTGTLFYIGKGRPDRPYYRKNRKFATPRNKENIIILHKNLDEKTAFRYEMMLINFYGRNDLFPEWGILMNQTNGGDGIRGYKFDKKTVDKIRKKNSGLHNANSVARDWYHPVHGEVKGVPVATLSQMYPEQKLDTGTLSRVANELLNQHKGWTLLCNGGKKILNRKSRKYHDWYHKTHGKVEKTSSADLARMFPDQKLDPGTLSKVSNRKLNHHKGWRLLKSYESENKNFRKKYDWYSEKFGIIKGKTCSELYKEFEDKCPLKLSCLFNVSMGLQRSHSGWILFKEKEG